MPRTCTICTHPEREAIDRALVAGESLRNIAQRSGTSATALHRHKGEHIPELLAQAHRVEQARGIALQEQVAAQEAQEEAHALDVMAELRRSFRRVDLLFDACDRWLRDPDNPDRYDIGPRAGDVRVIYQEPGPDGRPVRRKALLSELLDRVDGHGRTVERGEYRHADPRELVLKTAERLQGQLELLAKLLGQLDERPQINVLAAPEWIQIRALLVNTLGPYPDARSAVAAALLEVESGGRD